MKMEAIFSEKVLLFINIIGTIGGFISFFILDPHIWIVSIAVMGLCGLNVFNGLKSMKNPTSTMITSSN